MTAQFTLTTDDIPVKYADGKLVKADGFSDDDAANFIKNIASVKVGENTYSAAGRGSVKIVGEDGTVDLAAKSGENAIFDGSGSYTLEITATGYNKPYSFEIKPEAETTASSTTSSSTTTTSASTTKSSTTASSTTNPKTGVAGAAIPAAILALAGVSAFAARKKND